ncbi:MAG: hypothetical protein JNL80_11615 [Phycisphaerae bacterium]|nr:hypothetical protein [Phycisphaerae bacterium]
MTQMGDTGGNPGTRTTRRKPCVVCDAECEGQPRVKDPKGRYYCRSCYDRKAAELAARGGPTVELSIDPQPASDPFDDPSSAPLSDLGSIAAAAAAAPTAAPMQLACPACQAPIPSGGVFCVGCGHDLRTGKKTSMKVQKAPKATPAVRAGSQGPSAGAGGGALDGVLVNWTLGFSPSMAILIVFFYALAGGIVRVATAGSLFSGRTPVMANGWGGSLLFLGIGSSIAAVLVYFVGAWWFRVRVSWSGGEADVDAARSSYCATYLPSLVVLVMAAALCLQSVPGQLSESTQTVAISLHLLSEGLAYLGCLWLFWIAHRAFRAKLVGAALLLVALPWVVFILAAVLAVAAEGLKELKAEAGAASQRAAQFGIAGPHEDLPLAVEFPAAWQTRYNPPEEELRGIGLEAPSGEGVHVSVSDEEIDFESWASAVVEGYAEMEFTADAGVPLSSLGKWHGKGRAYRLSGQGETLIARILMTPTGEGRWLLIEALRSEPDVNRVQPLFERIYEGIDPTRRTK